MAKAIWLQGHQENTDPLLFDKKGLGKYLPEVSANLLFEDGDGTVTVESSSLSPTLKDKFQSFSSIETNVGHADIFKDKEVQEQIFAFLEENEN